VYYPRACDADEVETMVRGAFGVDCRVEMRRAGPLPGGVTGGDRGRGGVWERESGHAGSSSEPYDAVIVGGGPGGATGGAGAGAGGIARFGAGEKHFPQASHRGKFCCRGRFH